MDLVNFFFLLSLISLVKLVTAEDYLFESALFTYKRLNKGHVKNRLIKRLTTIDQHAFNDVVNLKVSTTKMTMHKGAVKNLPHLEKLRLKECSIQELPPDTFMNLSKLEKLQLQMNDIRSIEEGVFNGLPIKELCLQRNEISSIASGAFDNMPNLETIRLNSNFLSRWDSQWFVGTPKLKQLFFKRNVIEELPPRAFANLNGYHSENGEVLVDLQIFLSSNNLTSLHPEAFDGIDSLYTLDLRKNRIKEIDDKVFANMVELHTLNVSSNRLEKLDKKAFENIVEISNLDLSINWLECVAYDIVSKVETTDLSRNKLMKNECVCNLINSLSRDRNPNIIIANPDLECEP